MKTTEPCAYCKRPLRCTPRARAENSFCAKCLHERMAKATEGKTPRFVHHERGYVSIIWFPTRPASDAASS